MLGSSPNAPHWPKVPGTERARSPSKCVRSALTATARGSARPPGGPDLHPWDHPALLDGPGRHTASPKDGHPASALAGPWGGGCSPQNSGPLETDSRRRRGLSPARPRGRLPGAREGARSLTVAGA